MSILHFLISFERWQEHTDDKTKASVYCVWWKLVQISKTMISKYPGSKNWALSGRHMAQRSHMADLWASIYVRSLTAPLMKYHLGALSHLWGLKGIHRLQSKSFINIFFQITKGLNLSIQSVSLPKEGLLQPVWFGGKASGEQNEESLVSKMFIHRKLWQVRAI